MGTQHAAELGVLRVNSNAFSSLARTSSRISSSRASLPERPASRVPSRRQLGRMVADLLQLGHGGQHQPTPFDALAVVDLVHHVGDHGLVERGLLGGEVAEHLHLQLLRQVGDDGPVGLRRRRTNGPVTALEPLGRRFVTVPLDRFGVAAS